jgi:hypothetical protein
LGDAGLSSPLILFVAVSMLVLVAAGLRASRSTARPESEPTLDDGPDRPSPGPLTIAGQALTLTLLALVLLIGFTGSPTSGANPVPPAVFSVFWYGGLLLAVLVGDVWAAVNPAVAVATVVDLARGRTADVAPSAPSGEPARRPSGPPGTGDATRVAVLDPSTGRSIGDVALDPGDTPGGRPSDTGSGDLWWLPPILLVGFVVLWICWPGGLRPRPTATYVAIWTAVMVIGGIARGPGWVRRHDPFGLLFSAAAACSPVRWRHGRPTLTSPTRHLASRLRDPAATRPDLSVAAVLVVMLGATIFDGVRVTQAWSELIGPRSLTSLGIVNTFALVWIVVTVAAVWMAATRAVAALTGDRDDGDGDGEDDGDATRLALALAPALAAIVVVSRLASDLERFLLSSQNLVSLASDPFADGADLLGTVDWVDHPILSPTALAWTGLSLLLAGHLIALVALHDRTVVWFGAPVAARAIWPLTGFVVVSLAVALQLLGI